jgi:hypothetical protein
MEPIRPEQRFQQRMSLRQSTEVGTRFDLQKPSINGRQLTAYTSTGIGLLDGPPVGIDLPGRLRPPKASVCQVELPIETSQLGSGLRVVVGAADDQFLHLGGQSGEVDRRA